MGGSDQAHLVFRSVNSRELIADPDGRILERLKAGEVHDAFGVGDDIGLDGLVIRE